MISKTRDGFVKEIFKVKMNFFIFSAFIFFQGCNQIDSKQEEELTAPRLKQIAVYSTLVREPSGLAYNTRNNSLMTVSDADAAVYEMDFNGNIIKELKISADDLEGIALSKDCDTIYVAEERNQLISKFLFDGTKISSLKINVSTKENHSLEGVTLDNHNHLFVLNEKEPCLLLEFSGTTEIMRRILNFSKDVSDICYDDKLDCFWIISDESEAVVKVSKSGYAINKYSIPFTKGEGISLVENKIYIVNDLDGKLYVFEKPE